MATYKEIAEDIVASNPNLSHGGDYKGFVEDIQKNNPELQFDITPDAPKPHGLKRVLAMLSNIPEDALNVAKGIGETVLAGSEIATGQFIPRLAMGKKPAIVDVVAGAPQAMADSAQRLVGTAQAAGIPLPLGNPEENIAAAEKKPVSTLMDALSLVGGAKGVAKLRSPVVEGAMGSKPVKVNVEAPDLINNLRQPAEFARNASKDYHKAVVHTYNEFKNSMGDIEKNNPTKIADVSDLALEWAADGNIALPKKLMDIAEGNASGNLTLSELQQVKNDITGRISKNKLSGDYRSVDIPKMELINDINQLILGTFEGMGDIYKKFGTRIEKLKSIKQLRKPETALDFIMNQENDVRLENATDVLSKNVVKQIKDYKSTANTKIPIVTKFTGKNLGQLVKRNPLKPKEK